MACLVLSDPDKGLGRLVSGGGYLGGQCSRLMCFSSSATSSLEQQWGSEILQQDGTEGSPNPAASSLGRKGW